MLELPSRRAKVYRPVHEAVRELNDIALMRGTKSEHVPTAIVEMKRAIAVQPNSKELWNNLGTLLWRHREYEEAMACFRRTLRMDPNFAEAYHNRALVFEDLGYITQAEEDFARALELSPNYLNAKWCRGMMRLSLGNYERGLEEYETRIPFRVKDGKPLYPKFKAPYWQGEDIMDKRIFCCVEQGIGDTILFSRFLPWLANQVGVGGVVYLCCSHEIMVLLWEFHEAGFVEYVPEGTPIPECDFSVVMGSLPWHARTTLATLPSDPGFIWRRAFLQSRLGGADVPKPMGPEPFRVGICWTGNPEQDRNLERSIPLELMLTLAEHPKVWLYSLQVGPGQADIERLCAQDIVCDLGPQLRQRGLTVTATAILQMDLIVTCCTSIAHLCGSLGVKAWVPLCKNPYWVWMRDRPDSPWYPSLRLFRQTVTGEWRSVMQQVRDELFDLVDARSGQPVEAEHG